MSDITVKLRYFPLGPVVGTAVPIRTGDLDAIAGKHGVTITLEKIKGKNSQVQGESIREETMESTVEEITQEVITVTSQDEVSFRKAVGELIRKYRAPRTVYATLGSNEEGKRLLSRISDEYDGWS
jgi:hypothetical protein